jgi:hypothetical protein
VTCRAFHHLILVPKYFLILLVNDSEYSRSAGAKPILSLLAVFISFPLARVAAAVAAADFCCCCCAPQLHPAPREVLKKRKSPVASGMAFGHVCVGVGAVGVGEVAVCWER